MQNIWWWWFNHSVMSNFCNSMDCSPPGSSVHVIFQARILEWVAISYSRRSSQSRDRTLVSHIAGRFFTVWTTREAWRTVWWFLKKLKVELPYDLVIPILGIYPEKIIIQKYICIPMFTAAVFTISRAWKQPKCSLTEKWIKKMWYIVQWNISQPLKRVK